MCCVPSLLMVLFLNHTDSLTASCLFLVLTFLAVECARHSTTCLLPHATWLLSEIVLVFRSWPHSFLISPTDRADLKGEDEELLLEEVLPQTEEMK